MANRIKGSSMTVYANDTQLDRIQTFGVSSRLDSEDLREIGNLDIVEVLDNVPTVDITCDANQYGSIKTLAKFAGKNRDWGHLAVELHDGTYATATLQVRPGDYYINEMKYTLAAASGETVVEYLLVAGDKPAAGSHRYNLLTIDDAGVLDMVNGADVLVATPLTAANVPWASVPAGQLVLAVVYVKDATVLTEENILNANKLESIDLKDFEFAKVDFVCPVKETGDNTTDDKVTRSMYVEDAFINRYDAAFSVNGLATESMSLESDNKKWFLNTAGTIFVDRFDGFDGTGDAATLSYTPTALDNGNAYLKVYRYDTVAGTYHELSYTTHFTLAGTALSFVNSTLDANDTVIVRYCTASTGVAAADIPFFKRTPADIDPHPVIPGGLRHGQVEVYLTTDADTDDLGAFPATPDIITTEKGVLRLQSVSISSQLGREALYEIGHKRAYDRPLTFPIPITIQVESLQSDLREFARLTGKDFATAKEMSIEQFLKNLDLVVKIWREDDVARGLMGTSAPGRVVPLKTIVVKDVSITDENAELRVDGNGTQTFGMKANTNLTVSAVI